VTKYKNKVANIYKLILQLSNLKESKNKNLDNWLKSTLNRRIQKIFDAFENFDLRVASNEIFFECQKDIQWYLKRGGGDKKTLDEFTINWIKLMTPFTPHLAEELWNKEKSDFVSNESYPEFNPKEISEKDEVGERILSELVDDTNEILKVTKIKPKKICIYLAPTWKKELFRRALELIAENKLDVGTIMKEAMSDPNKKVNAKKISQFAGKLPGEIKKLSENEKRRYLVKIKGKDYLINAKDHLEKTFSCKVEIYDADDKDIYDPADKSRHAVPLRPAIYIE
ncbi:MAG: class I tRNA ligase family protein, partial [Thermoplasmatales archaeon]